MQEVVFVQLVGHLDVSGGDVTRAQLGAYGPHPLQNVQLVFEDEPRNVQLSGVVAGGRVGQCDRIGCVGVPLVGDGVYAVFYAEGRYEAQFVDGFWVFEGVLERDVPAKGMAHHVDLAQIIVLPPLLYAVDEVVLVLLQV